MKRLSLNDFICRFFTQVGQADWTFDYIEIWRKKMKADSVNIDNIPHNLTDTCMATAKQL